MRRFEVTEEQFSRSKHLPGAVIVEESKLKEIPEGTVYLTRERLRSYFHELSVRIQNRSETELDDYEEHLLDEIFGAPNSDNPS